jgi:hypothetical protein
MKKLIKSKISKNRIIKIRKNKKETLKLKFEYNACFLFI